jgi:hypothetical protein
MEFQRSPPGRHLGASLTSLVPARDGWDGVPRDNLLDRSGPRWRARDWGPRVKNTTWEATAVGSTRAEDTLRRSIVKSGSTTCPKPGGGGAGKWQAAEVPQGTMAHRVGHPGARGGGGVKGTSPPPIPFTGVSEGPREGGPGWAEPIPEGTPDTATRRSSPLGRPRRRRWT